MKVHSETTRLLSDVPAKTSMRRRGQLLVSALLLAATQSFAQDSSVAEVEQPTDSQRVYIGRTYYCLLSLDRCRHPNSFSIVPTPSAFDTNRLTSGSGIFFTVEAVVRGQESPRSRYFKVTTNSGSIGFIDALHFRTGDPKDDTSIQSNCAFELLDDDSERRIRAAELVESTEVV